MWSESVMRETISCVSLIVIPGNLKPWITEWFGLLELVIATWHFQLYNLFWSLLLKAKASRLCRLVCFLKHQTCWWLGRYVYVFLYYQTNSADVYSAVKGCLYGNGCFLVLEFIFVDIHWNMVILILSHIVYQHFHFCDGSYFEAFLTFTLIFAMPLCLFFLMNIVQMTFCLLC